MRYNKPRPPRSPKTPKEKNDALEHPSCNISKSSFKKIKAIAAQSKIPIARLIAIAIDNEFDTANPFSYEIPSLDNIPYIEDAAFSESAKIHNYLMNNWAAGIGYDQILIVREDIGISDKTRLLLGVRELLKKEMLIEKNYKETPWSKAGKILCIPEESRYIAEEQKKYKKIETIKAMQNERNPLDDLEK